MKKLKGALIPKEFLIREKCIQEFKCKHRLPTNSFKTKIIKQVRQLLENEGIKVRDDRVIDFEVKLWDPK